MGPKWKGQISQRRSISNPLRPNPSHKGRTCALTRRRRDVRNLRRSDLYPSRESSMLIVFYSIISMKFKLSVLLCLLLQLSRKQDHSNSGQLATFSIYSANNDILPEKSNHKNLGTIKSSNTPPPDEKSVCNLASLALPIFIVKLANTRRGWEARLSLGSFRTTFRVLPPRNLWDQRRSPYWSQELAPGGIYAYCFDQSGSRRCSLVKSVRNVRVRGFFGYRNCALHV